MGSMSNLYVPHDQAGFAHGEADVLDRKLREGDMLAWQGDPRLWLGMGLITQGGKVVGRRYEVWRTTEEGEDVLVGHWRLEEFDRILVDLVAMDPRSRNHVPVADRLDQGDKAKEAAVSAEFRDAAGAMFEHAMKLAHDTTQPLTDFRQFPGTRDRTDIARPEAT